MRLDVPQAVPRRRESESTPPAPPLDPSPMERRHETLAARAADRRPMPQASQSRLRQPDSTHKPVSPSIAPRDQRTRRDAIPQLAIGLSLREEERRVLAEVGRFRVVRTAILPSPSIAIGTHAWNAILRSYAKKGLCKLTPSTLDGTVAAVGSSVSRWFR